LSSPGGDLTEYPFCSKTGEKLRHQRDPGLKLRAEERAKAYKGWVVEKKPKIRRTIKGGGGGGGGRAIHETSKSVSKS